MAPKVVVTQKYLTLMLSLEDKEPGLSLVGLGLGLVSLGLDLVKYGLGASRGQLPECKMQINEKNK